MCVCVCIFKGCRGGVGGVFARVSCQTTPCRLVCLPLTLPLPFPPPSPSHPCVQPRVVRIVNPYLQWRSERVGICLVL